MKSPQDNKPSKIDKQIKSLIAKAEDGNKDAIEKIYQLALSDSSIFELNSIDSDDLTVFPILIENQVEIKSKTTQNGFFQTKRQVFKISDYLAIAWIFHKIYHEPSAPYIYALAKRMMNIKNIKSAQRWYMTAALMARIDASRCEDKTAPQGILIIESEFTDIKKTLQDKNSFNEAIKFALQKEEEFKSRSLPSWICSHGIRAFSGELEYKSEDIWKKERSKIREKYTNQIIND